MAEEQSGYPRILIPADQTCLGRWRMWQEDLIDATHIRDLTAAANPGTLVGSPTFAVDHQGVANRSMLFDGTTQYINVGDVAALDLVGLQPFTITLWLYVIAPIATSWCGIVTKCNIAGAQRQYTLSIDANRFITIRISENSGGYDFIQIDTQTPIATLRWYHVAATYGGGTSPTSIKLYLNGKIIPVTTSSSGTFTGMENSTSNFRIGNEMSNRYFHGRLSLVNFYNRALTDSEVNLLAQSGRV